MAVIGGLWLAFRVFTTQKVALNFITFGPVTLLGIGIVLPVLWRVRRDHSLDELGITKRRAAVSLILGLLLSGIQYTQTLANAKLSSIEKMIPLVTMAITVGLFEAAFFRGWVQLRIEKALGILLGILIGAGIYALYHIGYGMEPGEIVFLFLIGLIYAAVFRLTKNILIIWPFLTPMGGLFNNIKEGPTLPFEATYGFVLVLAAMILCVILSDPTYQQRTVTRSLFWGRSQGSI